MVEAAKPPPDSTLTLSGSALPFGSRQNDGCAALRSSPLPTGEGSVRREAARLFEGHPHCTIYPCDAVEVMPLLGG